MTTQISVVVEYTLFHICWFCICRWEYNIFGYPASLVHNFEVSYTHNFVKTLNLLRTLLANKLFSFYCLIEEKTLTCNAVKVIAGLIPWTVLESFRSIGRNDDFSNILSGIGVRQESGIWKRRFVYQAMMGLIPEKDQIRQTSRFKSIESQISNGLYQGCIQTCFTSHTVFTLSCLLNFKVIYFNKCCFLVQFV